jgi:Firmicute plasmid replication protein (RepL)
MSGSFSMMNPSFAEELSKDKRFGGGEFRVFYFLIGRMDLNGSVQMSQGDIGKEISMKQSAVCRAMKVWVESGVIRAAGKRGQTATYTFNPYFVFRGKPSNVAQIQQKWDADR